MSETKNNDTNNSLSTLVTGIVIGAAITYLFTTESGKKIRDELIKEGSKLLENIGDEVEKAKDKAQSEGEKLLTDVKAKKEEIEEEVQSAVKQVKKDIQEVTAGVGESAEEIPQQIHEIQKKGRKFFFSKKSPAHES